MNKLLLLLAIISVSFNTGWRKLTIVPEDKIVIVDGVSYKCSKFPVFDSNIHAAHLNKDDIDNVETKDGKPKKFTDEELKPILDAWKFENDKNLAEPPTMFEPKPKTAQMFELYMMMVSMDKINELLIEFPNNKDLLEEKNRIQSLINVNKQRFKK